MTVLTCKVVAWLRQSPGGDPLDDDAIVDIGAQMDVESDDGSGWLHVSVVTIDGKCKVGFVDARCAQADGPPSPPQPRVGNQPDSGNTDRPVPNPGSCWVYVQSNGKIYHVVDGVAALLAIGYSGNGTHENNPDDQCMPNHGPLPRGVYAIGAPIQFKSMQFCLPLTPNRGNAMCGRAGFLIHDGNFALNQGISNHGMTSEGCICLQQAFRETMWASGHRNLKVARDDGDVLTFGFINAADTPVADEQGARLGTLQLNAVVDVIHVDPNAPGNLFVVDDAGGSGLAGFVVAGAVSLISGASNPSNPNPQPAAPPVLPVARGFRFTANPNEVATATTTPQVPDVIPALMTNWPSLNESGARLLCAQFLFETGDGKFCFNWNLGNVKSPRDDIPHMYLRNVWECEDAASASAAVANSNGLAHIATASEIQAHGWSCPGAIVVYSPPHLQCRFRAYPSLTEGAAEWCARFVKNSTTNPALLSQLNGGDIAGFTHSLKMAGYFTAAENSYRAGLVAKKSKIDAALA